MNEQDMKLLAKVIREAEDLCDDCDSYEDEFSPEGEGFPPDSSLLREALDQFHLRFSTPIR